MMNKVAQFYRELVATANGSVMESAISTRW
jgi:hypothetical protein